MMAWKEDTKCSFEENSDVVVNLVKHITSLTNGKETSMIVTYKKIPTSLHNAILVRKSKSTTPLFLLTFEVFNMNIQNFY